MCSSEMFLKLSLYIWNRRSWPSPMLTWHDDSLNCREKAKSTIKKTNRQWKDPLSSDPQIVTHFDTERFWDSLQILFVVDPKEHTFLLRSFYTHNSLKGVSNLGRFGKVAKCGTYGGRRQFISAVQWRERLLKFCQKKLARSHGK